MLHQVGDLFELNVKLRRQKVNITRTSRSSGTKQDMIMRPDILRKVVLKSKVQDICFVFIEFHPDTVMADEQQVGSLE